MQVQLLLALTFSGAALGRLVPVHTGADCGGDDANDCHPELSTWSAMNDTLTAVATLVTIISLLEQSRSSLSKGVMVIATDWLGANGRYPYAFLRTLQARHEQPVYTADIQHLLADGHRGNNVSDDGHSADNGLPIAPPCRRPASADRRHSFLLPPRSRYVILFRGSGAVAAQDQFAELSNMNYTFWDVDVYYLIVVPEFDSDLRRMIYGVWNNLSIFKYAAV